MSKSLSHIALPAIGVSALVLAGAVTAANRDYGDAKIESLERRVEQVQTHAETASATANAATGRATELEGEIAAANERIADLQRTGPTLTKGVPASSEPLGLGRAAHEDEIAAWDVDVLPDGRGLPVGSGDVFTGEEVFVAKCGFCHGDFAEGVDNWPVLAGGIGTLAKKDPVKTVGSYWPHLSTAWDYIHRSMPFGEAGTLTADETYAIVAYLLYSNDLVDDDFELNQDNFLEVAMPNADGFVIDDRPETEYTEWRQEPCMENCKDEVEVTMRTVFLVETPPEGGSESIMNEASDVELPSFTAAGPSFIPETSQPAAEAESVEVASLDEQNGPDDGSALLAVGESVFKKCSTCHQVGEGAQNRVGPHLNGLLGRTMGGVEGFNYSGAFQAALAENRMWDEAALKQFVADPKGYMAGNKMAFAGLKSQDDVDALVAYLGSLGD